jgi:hypothetical protein
MNKEVFMFDLLLVILGGVAGSWLIIKMIKLIFRKDPIEEGCICTHTRLSKNINYDCPLHGDWR